MLFASIVKVSPSLMPKTNRKILNVQNQCELPWIGCSVVHFKSTQQKCASQPMHAAVTETALSAQRELFQGLFRGLKEAKRHRISDEAADQGRLKAAVEAADTALRKHLGAAMVEAKKGQLGHQQVRRVDELLTVALRLDADMSKS